MRIEQLHRPTAGHTQCLIETELDQIDSKAFHDEVSVEEAQDHLTTKYAKTSTDDRAPLILRELLNVLPTRGQKKPVT